MESRSSLFDFDVRYKTEGNDKTFHALSKPATRQEGNDKTLHALSKGMAMRERDSYERRRSEHSGIEEQTVLL